MAKIRIYEPAMCCSTGVCGPSVDEELLRISTVVDKIKSKNFDIKRFNLANDSDEFVKNESVNKLLNEKEEEALPIVILDDKIVLSGRYPTNKELEEMTGIKLEDSNNSCCGGSSCC